MKYRSESANSLRYLQQSRTTPSRLGSTNSKRNFKEAYLELVEKIYNEQG